MNQTLVVSGRCQAEVLKVVDELCYLKRITRSILIGDLLSKWADEELSRLPSNGGTDSLSVDNTTSSP